MIGWGWPFHSALFEDNTFRITIIFFPRTHWVNSLWHSNTMWEYRSESTLGQTMAWCLTALPEPMLTLPEPSVMFLGFQTELMKISINKMCFEIMHLKLQPDLPGANELTLCGLVTLQIRVIIVSGNGLLPDGTKPLPEPMLISHYWVLWHSLNSNFTAKQFFCKISLKTIILKLQPHLPGPNELIHPGPSTSPSLLGSWASSSSIPPAFKDAFMSFKVMYLMSRRNLF